MPNPGLPDRISRTHVVPGNIMSVEFKLFDFMTLKQFLYLVVCAAFSYLFFGILPDNIFKFLIPGVIMIAGIIIAFVQFNGEPFEVYTTNFILGVIQPQRRVWSKVPMLSTKPTRIENEEEDTNYKNAYKSLSDNYVTEQEVIPVNFNASQTSVDAEEKNFLKSQNITDFNFSNNSNNNLPKADLSKLNFDFAETASSDNRVKDNPSNINLLLQSLPQNSDTISVNSNKNSDTIDTNLDMNLPEMNPPKTVFGQGNVSATSPAFTINMDEDEKNMPTQSQSTTNSMPDPMSGNTTLPIPENGQLVNTTSPTPDFIPLANEKSQSERVNEMPEVNLNIGNSNTPIINSSQTFGEENVHMPTISEPEVRNTIIENFHMIPELSVTPTITNSSDTTTITSALDQTSSVPVTDMPMMTTTNTQNTFSLSDPLSLGSTVSMKEMPTSSSDLFTQNSTPDIMNAMSPTPVQDINSVIPQSVDLSSPVFTPSTSEMRSNPSTNNMEIGGNFSRDNRMESKPMMQLSETPPVSSTADVQTAKIHGRVLSIDLMAISNLAVILFDADAKALESAVTNGKGEFTFFQTPKVFEIKIHSTKRFNFSPMDKSTREIIIQEMPEGYTKGGSVMQMNSSGNTDIISLPDAEEMVSSADSKISNTINGLVKDDAGHYLAGVLVSIKDVNGATIRALATNPLGQFFSHSTMPAGTYYISFEKDGYSSLVFTAKLDGRIFNPKVYIIKNQNLQRI